MEQETLHPPGSNVLVLEDDRPISELLVWVLSEAGYQVTAVTTVHEAMNVCQDRLPDVIVADLLLPDGMGSELLIELRGSRNGGTPPSVVMSAMPHACRQAEEAGARYCLQKPFDLAEMLDTVSQLAQGRNGQHEVNDRDS